MLFFKSHWRPNSNWWARFNYSETGLRTGNCDGCLPIKWCSHIGLIKDNSDFDSSDIEEVLKESTDNLKAQYYAIHKGKNFHWLQFLFNTKHGT